MSETLSPELGWDAEFAAGCWPLTDQERELLTESLRSEGCRDPVLYWEAEGHPIVDGHNRYRICRELGIAFPTRGMTFADRKAVLVWLLENQMGRRNTCEIQQAWLRAKLYALRKQSVPESAAAPNIAREVAVETGVSERTILKDAEYAKALEELTAKSALLGKMGHKGQIFKRDVVLLNRAAPAILRGIENAPEADRKLICKQAAHDMRQKPGRPLPDAQQVRLTPLSSIRDLMGKIVRLKTDAFDACGGARNPVAVKWEGELRHALNQAFDVLKGWIDEVNRLQKGP